MRTKEGDKVLLVLGQKTGVFIVRLKRGTKFYWSWVRRPVFIVRTKEGDKVLLVLGQKTSVHHVRTKEGNKVLLVLGQKTGVFIVRTKEGNKVLLVFSLVLTMNTGLLTQDQ